MTSALVDWPDASEFSFAENGTLLMDVEERRIIEQAIESEQRETPDAKQRGILIAAFLCFLAAEYCILVGLTPWVVMAVVAAVVLGALTQQLRTKRPRADRHFLNRPLAPSTIECLKSQLPQDLIEALSGLRAGGSLLRVKDLYDLLECDDCLRASMIYQAVREAQDTAIAGGEGPTYH